MTEEKLKAEEVLVLAKLAEYEFNGRSDLEMLGHIRTQMQKGRQWDFDKKIWRAE